MVQPLNQQTLPQQPPYQPSQQHVLPSLSQCCRIGFRPHTTGTNVVTVIIANTEFSTLIVL